MESLDLDQAIVVALGSNLPGGFDSCEALLEAAVALMPDYGIVVKTRSRWWRAAAWPDPAAPGYLNGVALVGTQLAPGDLLKALLAIEARLGRRRALRNAPRTLDLDLIAFGRTVEAARGLELPHPRAHERLFVMGPLAEVAPDWRHPVLGDTAAALAAKATVGLDAKPV